ncbi:MAG: hypothetical protein Q6351_002920 [Candidatus Njordarchaeum guaymaensis]
MISLLTTVANYIEPGLILAVSVMILVVTAVFFHIFLRLIGGHGSIKNIWKALYYGATPCIFGGFLPYISLFVAFYSLLLQFYIRPKVLYNIPESRMLPFVSSIIALAFIEMFVFESTVGL